MSLGRSHNVSKLHFRNYAKMAIRVLPLSRAVIKAKWIHVYQSIVGSTFLSIAPHHPTMGELTIS